MRLDKHRIIAVISVAVIAAVLALLIIYARRTDVEYRILLDNLHVNTNLSPNPAPKPGEKILIFAPHEDDETLGSGGFIQQAVLVGAKLKFVLMTNGEYPEIDVVLFEENLGLNPDAFIRLGYRRQQETIVALKYLGVSNPDVTFLGYPNQYLNKMWEPRHWLPQNPVRSARTGSTRSPYRNSFTPKAIYCGQSMLTDVEKLILAYKPDRIITIHPNDIHVDHWPTGAVVAYALNELAARGEDFARKTSVYTYLIHRDLWPQPRGYEPERALEPSAGLLDVRQTDWTGRPLTRPETGRKHEAIRLYRTQLGSYDPLLQSFARKTELYGQMPEVSWPASQITPIRTIITDPVADRVLAATHPEADIHYVSLGRQGNRMIVEITTKADAENSTVYHFSIHSGGRTDADRLIAEYDWVEKTAYGREVRNSRLTDISSQELQSRMHGKTAILQAPWPLTGLNSTFLMVRAWTTAGNVTIDQTAETVLRLGNVR